MNIIRNLCLLGFSYWTLTTLTTVNDIKWKHETNVQRIEALRISAKPTIVQIKKLIDDFTKK